MLYVRKNKKLTLRYKCECRLFPRLSNAIKPFLPALTVIDMSCCIGAPLALNIDSILSPFGATILFLVITFHLLAFVAGYFFTGFFFSKAPDVKALQRTISYETGMQSSLLALALATKFFQDPLVGVPPAISVSFQYSFVTSIFFY